MNIARSLVRRATSWPLDSQHVARRNALVALSVLADRRQERLEVEEFLARHLAPRSADDTRATAGQSA